MSICWDVRVGDGRTDEIDDVNGPVVRFFEEMLGIIGSMRDVVLL